MTAALLLETDWFAAAFGITFGVGLAILACLFIAALLGFFDK